MRSVRATLGALLVGCALIAAPSASAQDPGRWLLTGASTVPVTYWQGLTSDPQDSRLYFAGIFEGLWRTDPLLGETAGLPSAIPPGVKATEGYNHIGDLTWNRAEGGRVILPLECFTPGVGNTCNTGSFGVSDPTSLAFRYYVKLDPAEIPKAMWAETSPDNSLIWTSSGNDLLAYPTADVRQANAAPTGPEIDAARRLTAAVPPTGVTGAVFRRGRLLLAGESDGTYQVWAVDPRTGARRLEIQMNNFCGESEGLDTIRTLGGELHWLIAPFDPGCQLTFGPTSALLHFVPTPGRQRFGVQVLSTTVGGIPGTVRAVVRVNRLNGRPLRRGHVSFAGGKARTNRNGIAIVDATLKRPGRFKALVQKGRRYGISGLVAVGVSPASAGLSVPRTGAG
jgi:hypothetical protein